MAKKTSEMIKTVDKRKYPSIIIKEYHDIIRELISVIAYMDGIKFIGEYSHQELIDYISKRHLKSSFFVLNELRVLRNRIAYDGFFIEYDLAALKIPNYLEIEDRLKKIIESILD